MFEWDEHTSPRVRWGRLLGIVQRAWMQAPEVGFESGKLSRISMV